MSLKIKENILQVRRMLCLEAAVRYGSISKAADNNNMKQSNLSVQIKELEAELGEPLVSRVYNGVKLTEAGQVVYSRVCDLHNIINKINDLNIQIFHMAGTIRLWTSDGLGIGYLSECFPEFYTLYPKVRVEILCSLEMPKLDEFDLAIVYKKPTDKFLHIVDKYDLKFGLYASKEYLAKFGCPKSFKDIEQNHRICTRDTYITAWSQWAELMEKAQYVAATTNSSAMLRQLIVDGVGLGLLPQSVATKEENLVHLSKIKLNFHHEFWLVVRQDVKNVDKIAALVEFIKKASKSL